MEVWLDPSPKGGRSTATRPHGRGSERQNGCAPVSQISSPTTDSARQRLQEQLDELTEFERPRLAAGILSDSGDAGDMAVSYDAQVELSRLDDRISRLREALYNTVPAQAKRDGLGLGATVVLSFEGSKDHETYLVGTASDVAPDVDIVTLDSPLGRALQQTPVGQSGSFRSPLGRSVKFTVVSLA
jgi:transcription elongation factor GreA